jgi:hypothetical protein
MLPIRICNRHAGQLAHRTPRRQASQRDPYGGFPSPNCGVTPALPVSAPLGHGPRRKKSPTQFEPEFCTSSAARVYTRVSPTEPFRCIFPLRDGLNDSLLPSASPERLPSSPAPSVLQTPPRQMALCQEYPIVAGMFHQTLFPGAVTHQRFDGGRNSSQ